MHLFRLLFAELGTNGEMHAPLPIVHSSQNGARASYTTDRMRLEGRASRRCTFATNVGSQINLCDR